MIEDTIDAESLLPSCEVTMSQVDYRAIWFAIPILLAWTLETPKTTITSYCVAR